MSEQPLIRCRDLTKVYRKGRIEVIPLEKLTLDVPCGEFLALMGPSGSGKTTLLNLISGIDQPTSGGLWVGNREISRMSRGQLTKWRATECGYIFQLYHLVSILSAYENVELPLLLQKGLSKSARRAKVNAALDLVGLADRADHRPSELSGGQEQRVAIARALVADPKLLVADEPTGDLDRESADQILSLLGELASVHKKTIVMVTHDAKAASAADRTLYLEKGQLVESREVAAL